MKSQSPMDFEIFAHLAFLTVELGPRSKVMAANESPFMIPYMSTIQMESLSFMEFEIFAIIAFLTQGQRSWHQMKAHMISLCL